MARNSCDNLKQHIAIEIGIGIGIDIANASATLLMPFSDKR